MSDAHGVARDQLRAFIERIERLEEEKKTIADDIKDVYGEAKSMGYDTKIMKKVVALRKKDDQERMEEEQILDTYLGALGMIPQFEMFDEEEAPKHTKQPAMAKTSPRKAAEAVSERTAQFHANASDEACETGPYEGRAEASADASDGVELVSRVVDGRTSTATSERMDATAGETAPESEIAPASQGEAEAPSVDSVSPEIHGSSDANTGGEDVTLEQNAAPRQAEALVSKTASAAHPVLVIRPHCQHPGEAICGGSGKNHCRACAAAMREEEEA